MNSSDTASVLKERLGDGLVAFSNAQCQPGEKPPAGSGGAASNKARRTIQTRRTLHGEKTVSPQSLSALQEFAKNRHAKAAPTK